MLAAGGDISPGLAGFLVVVGIGIALWLLVRSMNRQLRKVRFEEPEDSTDPSRPGPGTRRSEDTPPP